MTSNKLKVRKGDTVVVIHGKDSGRQGRILEAFPRENKVVVDGVAVVTKSKKPKNAQDKGGFVKLNQKIDASNVMIVCPGCKKGSRIGYRQEKNKKVRFCKKCDRIIETKHAKAPAKMENPTVAVKPGKAKEPIVKSESTVKTTGKAAKPTDAKAEKKPAGKVAEIAKKSKPTLKDN